MSEGRFPITFSDFIVLGDFQFARDGGEPETVTGITVGPFAIQLDDMDYARSLEGKELRVTLEVVDG